MLIAIACGSAFAVGKVIDFDIDGGEHATLNVADKKVSCLVADEDRRYRGNIDVDTDSEIHIDVDDYSFNGRKGFSVWYFDEGMGIYTIHRIFSFSRATGRFVECFPKYGD